MSAPQKYVASYICEDVLYADGRVPRNPRRHRGTDATADPRRRARRRVLGERPRRAGRHAPARRVAASQGVARRRARGGPPRCAAPDVPAACGAAHGARRVAGAVPRTLGRPPRRARTAPAPHGQDHIDCEGSRMTATSPRYDGVVERTAEGGVIRFERRLDYPIREVWDAITNPARVADWWLPFDAGISLDLRGGGEMVFVPTTGDEPMTVTCTIL